MEIKVNEAFIQKQKEDIRKEMKVILPPSSYNIKEDKRLLIPFMHYDKIGFVNKEGEVVVMPKYTAYYGECYQESDFIKVAVIETGYPKAGGKVSTYHRLLYGLINAKGEVVLEPLYLSLIPALNGKPLYTVRNRAYQYGVLTSDGKVEIPFGKYCWMDGFDSGLARVKLSMPRKDADDLISTNSMWGIIDEHDNVVLPIEYDNIWNFYNRNRYTTKVEKDGKSWDISLSELMGSKDKSVQGNRIHYGIRRSQSVSYGEYEGSYAQDVEGYSDDYINDAFEGDPEAYWNID